MNYLQTPRVQNLVMKASRFGPVRRNIWNQIMAQEADRDMRKRLMAIDQASRDKYRKRAQDQREEAIEADIDWRNDALDYREDQDKWAAGIAGVGAAANLGFGIYDMNQKMKAAEQERMFGKKILAALEG